MAYRLLTLVLVCILGSAAVVTAAEPASVLRLGVPGAADGQAAQMAEALALEVAKATRNRVAITVEAMPQYDRMTLEMVLRGDVDIGWIKSRNLGSSVPALEILGWPFLFDGELQAESFFAGAGGERVAELVDGRGLAIAAWIRAYPLQFLAKEDASQPEAFKGRRVAVAPNEAVSRFMRALGATAVPMPLEERAAAAANGAFDLTEGDFYSWSAAEYPETMSFAAMSSHYVPMIALCHTNAALAKVPPELHTALLHGLRRGALAARDTASRLNNEALLELSEGGMEIVPVDASPFREATEDELARIQSGADPRIVAAMETANVPPTVF